MPGMISKRAPDDITRQERVGVVYGEDVEAGHDESLARGLRNPHITLLHPHRPLQVAPCLRHALCSFLDARPGIDEILAASVAEKKPLVLPTSALIEIRLVLAVPLVWNFALYLMVLQTCMLVCWAPWRKR
eukprot:5320510-Amphidinium_carterae.1